MSESYRTVTTRFRSVSNSGGAILVDQPAARGHGTVWIPRSLIHGGDDRQFDFMGRGDEVSFRLMEWKAEEIGFA